MVQILGQTYEVHIEHFPDGTLKMFSLRPALIHNENLDPYLVLTSVAYHLRNGITRELPINPQRILGRLLMRDVGGDNNRATVRAEEIRILQIDDDLLYAMWNDASGNESNPDLNIFGVEWEFYPTPAGAGKGELPAKIKGIDTRSAREFIYMGKKLNCGISSILLWLGKHGRINNKRLAEECRRKFFWLEYRKIADVIGDEDELTISQLKKFVSMEGFTDLRLVIITTPRDYIVHDYPGIDYVLKPTLARCQSTNIIYLYLVFSYMNYL